MTELSFDIRDIIRAPGLAWSLRKMHAAFRGIIRAWLIYCIFSYIALLLTQTGRSAGFVNLIRYFEFFPYLQCSFNASWQFLVYGAGIILAILSLQVTATALARITFEDLRGNDVFQTYEALQFAKTHRSTVVLSVITLFVLFSVFPLSIILWGVTGRIPFIGPFIYGIMSIPLFFWGLLGVSVFIVFIIGIHIVPAITASLGEDVLETVIQTFSTVFHKPCRLLIYEATAHIVTIVSSLLLAVVSLGTMLATMSLGGRLFGGGFDRLFTISLYRIPGAVDFVFYNQRFFEQCPLMNNLNLVDVSNAAGAVHIAGWITGLSGLVVLAWLASYALSCCSAAQLLVYLVVRKRKDGEDIRLKRGSLNFIPEMPADDNTV